MVDARRLAEIVAGLTDPTAGGGLAPKLRERLESIATRSGGAVPLHGRLFAQFLHHAFPRDCPYPQEAGTMNPQTPEDWMKAKGRSTIVSKEQLEQLARETCPADVLQGQVPSYCQAEEEDLPWTNSEDRQDLLSAPGLGASPGAASFKRGYQARGSETPPWLLAWMMSLPAFFLVAFALELVIGPRSSRGHAGSIFRRKMSTLAPAMIFLWVVVVVCVVLELVDARAAFAAGIIFLKWRRCVSPFLACPTNIKMADLEV